MAQGKACHTQSPSPASTAWVPTPGRPILPCHLLSLIATECLPRHCLWTTHMDGYINGMFLSNSSSQKTMAM